MNQHMKNAWAQSILYPASMICVALAIVIFNGSAVMAQIQPVTLRVGQPAPPLPVYQWLKGRPVSLEKGQIYVVEFTNVSCGPCVESIPHFARLAKEYQGKATFISTYIFESRNYRPDSGNKDSLTADYTSHVKKFIAAHGSGFDNIHVAIDDPQETIVHTWMFPAGNRGGPVVYVIDLQGRIVWMGYPLELDQVIKQVLEGSFEPAIGLRSIAEKENAYKRVHQFLNAGDQTQSIAILDITLKISFVVKLSSGSYGILMNPKPTHMAGNY
jgi:thiol-disulfide isomerase/thioredoxin